MGVPQAGPPEERIATLVELVGGPVRAAALIGKTRTHVDNMRKPGAPLRLEDVLVLAREAGVSLDWVATGHTVRPDLVARGAGDFADAGSAGFEGLPGFVRLSPLRPEVVVAGGRPVERWTPSEFAVSAQWLDSAFGLTPETARYAIAGDGGMEPMIGKGAAVIVDARSGPTRTGIYLGAVGDELLARRLNRLPDGRAELIADADARWRYGLGEAAVELYRIVWVGQSL
jgi:phage repressor protein C with HTH and peptisase S24 domain